MATWTWQSEPGNETVSDPLEAASGRERKERLGFLRLAKTSIRIIGTLGPESAVARSFNVSKLPHAYGAYHKGIAAIAIFV